MNPDCKIGIAKNYQKARSFTNWNPLEILVSWGFNQLRDESILNYFTNGTFSIRFIKYNISYTNPEGKNSLDFIGLNYYSDVWFYGEYLYRISPTMREEDSVYNTNMNYPLYAEGFYSALKRLKKLKIPIVITENGMADSANKGLRDLWIKRYFYAMVKAMKEGVVIKGYIHWSLMDNFEWSHGYEMRFGLYHVDYKTQKRTLKEDSKVFIDIIKEYKKL